MAGHVIGIASSILTKSEGFEGRGFVVGSFLVQQVADNSPAALLGNDELRDRLWLGTERTSLE